MIDPKSTSSQVTKSWDAYWHGTGDTGAFSSGGASHPAVLAFWREFFQEVNQDNSDPAMIDLASGNGAVVEHALAVFGEGKAEITAVDVSEAAITNIKNRFPGVNGLVSDVCSIPFDSDSFDIVTSQFGIEYAGIEAIDEAARLVASGGWLTLLLHNSEGSIHHQCATNLKVVARVQESRFVPCAHEMFRAGFEAVRGADRAPYDEAARQLAPAVQTLEAILEEYGQSVADDTIARLYNDVGKIHNRIQHYDPEDVLAWLERMQGELETYEGRMSSMCESALDAESFNRIRTGLEAQGFVLSAAGPLMAPDNKIPLAWALIAKKGSKSSDGSELDGQKELKAWIKQKLEMAVHDLMDRGVVESIMVEAKPAWVFPLKVLIGKIREKNQAGGFDWFICGEVPTDHVHSSLASTPREAAKYLALKWQLDATRQDSDSGLVEKAQALYELVNEESLWQQ
jgi:SAM-dependent methyltransferase